MPRTKLTWHKARKCWRKKYQGKVYYLTKQGECKGKSDTAGYRIALDRWEKKKREIDRQPNEPTDDSPAVEMADYRRIKRDRPAAAGDKDTTASGSIAGYVEGRRLEATAGTISIETYKGCKFKLAEFVDYCQQNDITDLAEVNEAVLEDYRQCQFALLQPESGEDQIGKVTARKRLARLKQFLEWAWEQKLIEDLPRNIRKFARVPMNDERTRLERYGTWQPDEIRTLFNAASDRTKLLILLGVNCGYTQKDIATLEHSDVDYAEGMIRRKRHKTRIDQHHQLWPVTLKLLNRFKTDPRDSKLVLIGAKGNPLVTERINPDGNTSATDSVKLAFKRTKKKLKMESDRRGFSTFRKSGAMLIKKYCEDDRIVDLYLSHAASGMRKFYAEETYDKYFKALEWLGNHLKLDPEIE